MENPVFFDAADDDDFNPVEVCRYLELNVPDIWKRACSENLGSSFEYKELNDIATKTDSFMEEEIIALIRKRFPNHRFTGEELGSSGNDCKYEWLIDPIDGTVNYSAGIPMFGTSVALRKNGEAILGVIFDWPNNRIYSCVKGHGAWCNGEVLRVSSRKNLRECIVTICLTSSYNESYTNSVLEIVRKLQPHVRGVRILVCTVYELIWLAQGFTDCMINIRPSIGVGSCAGKLMVQEAGGRVSNIQGLPRQNIDSLLVSNSLIHDKITAIINS